MKKTKKKFEKEWQKTAKMMDYTQQNYEQIRRILQAENYANGMVSSSSRMQRGSSRREGNGAAGVLAMIYEKDQLSKESQKSYARHSILDDVHGDNEIAIDSESADADSARRRRNGAGN